MLIFIGQVFVLEKVKDQTKKAVIKNKIEFDDELLEISNDNGVGKPGTVRSLTINVFLIFYSRVNTRRSSDFKFKKVFRVSKKFLNCIMHCMIFTRYFQNVRLESFVSSV